MTPEDLRPSSWAPSLRTRLIAFLTIAMLPLGAIAVLQTIEVSQEAARLTERDVLARTAQAAGEQGAALREAIGASSALGIAAANLLDDPDACTGMMADFVAAHPSYAFAGFIRANGVMDCNSGGREIDYSGRADWEAFLLDQAPYVTVNRAGDVSGASVYIALNPVFDADGGLLGGQAISMPHGLAELRLASDAQDVELALVSPNGEILASSRGMDNIEPFERLGIVPETMSIPEDGLLIRTETADERRQPAAVLPLIENRIYVIGLWTSDDGAQPTTLYGRVVPLFPLLMWLAGLVVAYISVNNLVLKHLSRLSREMTRFNADDEEEAGFALDPDAPVEMQRIADRYNELIAGVAEDQAALRESITEKELLLREIHHRVKNNLQLIASLLNMQIRTLDDTQAKDVLKRVQDRVLSLSSIHQALYADDAFDKVNASVLLEKIVTGMSDLALSSGKPVEVSTQIAPVWLDPDQAVPLLLLATEAITNAAKYVGEGPDAPAHITCTLSEDDAGQVTLQVTNTTDADVTAGVETKNFALGARLIAAFASQLGGTVTTENTDHLHDLVVQFDNQLRNV